MPSNLFSNEAVSPRKHLEMCGGIFGHHEDCAGGDGDCVSSALDSGFSGM